MANGTCSVGVDWASGYWLAVVYRDNAYERVQVEPDFEALWDSFDSEVDRVLVDVPIGLCDKEDGVETERGRACDTLARSVLGSRSSSVFTPPARQAAELANGNGTHEEASAKNREIVGKGLSIQAYHIAPGIAEFDSFLRAATESREDIGRERVEESHPEVCLTAFNGETLEHPKTSAIGLGERLSALEAIIDNAGETFRQISDDLAAFKEQLDVAAIDADDVVDAMALAVTASADEDELHRLPDQPPKDAKGLPKQIVYRANEPFQFQ